MPEDPLEPSSSGSDANQPDTNADEFEQALLEVEQNLRSLKERYEQVQRDRQRRAELQQRRESIRKELPRSSSNRQALKSELKQIQEQLEIIELNLESRLFWGSLKQPFWQAVRFGGLGIIIGWILKSCAG
jgi:chromosome segregation ATPase